MLTLNIYYLIPTIFVAAITAQIKASGDKHVVSHIKLLELDMHVINILLLTKRKRVARTVDGVVLSLRNRTC